MACRQSGSETVQVSGTEDVGHQLTPVMTSKAGGPYARKVRFGE
jgi:hypothetical protein